MGDDFKRNRTPQRRDTGSNDRRRPQSDNARRLATDTRTMRRKKNRRRSTLERLMPAFIVIGLVLLLAVPVLWAMQSKWAASSSRKKTTSVVQQKEDEVSKEELEKQIKDLTTQAEKLAAEYDYDSAIKKIGEALKLQPQNKDLISLKVKYAAGLDSLEEWTGDVEHIFFHQLIVDPSITFAEKNKDLWTNFNAVMTTVDEFKAMMQSMYEKGYILVKISDVIDVKENKDGTRTVTKKSLMLPKGKKPFILSEDDTNFYRATTLKVGGLGQKFVLDENGKPKVEYIDKNGKTLVGDYDVVPVLDTFIEEHPDFSYRGAKGYIGVTGYDGVLGYRINEIHESETQIQSDNLEEDREMVKKIAKACRDNGWEFASHSYSHNYMSNQTVAEVKQDAQWWQDEVEKYIGETDVYLFPYGDWGQNGEHGAEKLQVLEDFGFTSMHGVGIKTYNIVKDGYYFMDRANLDGQSLCNRADILSKFFDAKELWDKGRPTAYGSITN